MNWPLEFFLFSVVLMLVWVVLYRRASKTEIAGFLVLPNFALYLLYTLYLFKPLFDPELGRGGGAFAAGMYIMLLSPLHLLLVFVTLLFFEKVYQVRWLKQVLIFVALPMAAMAFGYVLSEHGHDVEEKKRQEYFERLNAEEQQDKIANNKTEIEFSTFLKSFTTDSIFQRDHTHIPLPVYYMTAALETDTVDHYYEHNFPFLLQKQHELFFIYENWEMAGKMSDKRNIIINEKEWRTGYHFRNTLEGWQLFEIQKAPL